MATTDVEPGHPRAAANTRKAAWRTESLSFSAGTIRKQSLILVLLRLPAFIPLLLPLPGLVRGSVKWLRAAPMALAPALALAITEILVNPPARPFAGASLALAFLAFAAIVAALRSRPS